MDWKEIYQQKLVSAQEAATLIESGDRIFIGGARGIPAELVDAICDRTELTDIEFIGANNGTPCKCMYDPECFGRTSYTTLFMGSADRKYYGLGNIKVSSVQYNKTIRAAADVHKVNVLAMEVSEPDEEGYVYYGAYNTSWGSLDRRVEKRIFQINNRQLQIKGFGNRIHVSEVDALCRCDYDIKEYVYKKATDADVLIAEHILPYIPENATLQIGIGGIPNAVGYKLADRKNMRMHSELLSDSLIYLVKEGCIDPEHAIASFAISEKEEIDETVLKAVRMGPLDVVNDPYEIGKNPNLISINSCIMVDLIGQVCSEAIGTRQYSGVGGQLDFVRAAAISEGGKSFICVASRHREKDGSWSSNIKPLLPEGAIVTTPKTDVMYIVTEWGVADLFNRPTEDRAYALINIAHPDFRLELFKKAIESGLIRKSAADIGKINLQEIEVKEADDEQGLRGVVYPIQYR